MPALSVAWQYPRRQWEPHRSGVHPCRNFFYVLAAAL